MKIKCRDCGKKFDYDLYSGMCPMCGTYNRMESDTVGGEKTPSNRIKTAAEIRSTGKYESMDLMQQESDKRNLSRDYNLPELDSNNVIPKRAENKSNVEQNMYHKSASPNRNNQLRQKQTGKKTSVKAVVILILLMICIPFATYFGSSVVADVMSENQSQGVVSVTQLNLGDVVSGNDGTLIFSQMESADDLGVTVPEGMRLVRIPYVAAPLEEEDGYCSFLDLKVYMQLPDDSYTVPLKELDLEDLGMTSTAVNQLGSGNFISSANTCIMFLIPADATSTNLIVQRLDEEFQGNILENHSITMMLKEAE